MNNREDLLQKFQTMDEKEKLEIENLLKSFPDEFRVIENRINAKTIDEYYKIAHDLEHKYQTEIIQNQVEWTELQTQKEIKELLVYLSQIGDVKSYRTIEDITKNGNPEILDFSFVALQISRLKLENNLSDEPVGFISSALGGKGNKMRCYFVVYSKGEIEKAKESKISSELKGICVESDSELEEIENHGRYILVKILVSMNYAIGSIIDNLTSKFSFLEEEYICTNVEKPTKEFIENWMASD